MSTAKVKQGTVSQYRHLKLEFYRILNTKKSQEGLYSGDIRAYLSGLTWKYEKERLAAGEGPVSSHITSLDWAIKKYKDDLRNNRLRKTYADVLREWRSEENNYGLLRPPTKEPLLSPPVPNIGKWEGNDLNLMSLFSGVFGLDIGFLAERFNPKLALDLDRDAVNSVKENLPGLPCLGEDISKVTTKDLLNEAGLGVGELDVLTGGPPCQPFSTAGKRASMGDPRSSPLKEFIRVVKEARPRCFVMEEVEGLLSARVNHVPLNERGGRRLSEDEKKGSAFNKVLSMLDSTGYKYWWGTLNAAEYGAPQVRKRLIFIGLRDGTPEPPRPTHSKVPERPMGREPLEPLTTLWESTLDLQSEEHTYSPWTEKAYRYMKLIPPGGNWRQLPEDIKPEAMGGAYRSGGGKMGYFRRLPWDEPSPTVVASPNHKGTMFGHPEKMRPLSVEEYKRVQGFPDDWGLPGSTHAKYKLIGNAVPVHLSHAIAKKVRELLEQ